MNNRNIKQSLIMVADRLESFAINEGYIADLTYGTTEVLRSLPTIDGLSELTAEMEKDISEDLLRLQMCFSILSQSVIEGKNIISNRDKFTNLYSLIKTICTSSLNLLDSLSPSLERLKADQSFDVLTLDSRFTVF